MKEKNGYFEMLRGVAIMMVVAIHTFGMADSTLKIGIRQVLNCAVPLFFALSGLFLYKKPLTCKSEILAFWKRQILKVYYPVLLWSLPTFALNIFYFHRPVSIELLQLFTCSYYVYYFIAVIIQFYLLLPLLQKLRITELGGVISSIIISTTMIIVVTYCNIVMGMNLPLIIYAGCCLLWIFFFIIGCALSKTDRNYSVFWMIPLVIVCICLSIIESKYLLNKYGTGVGIKSSAFLFSSVMCLFLLSSTVENQYKEVKKIIPNVCRFLEYIGSVSFAIYLTHYYFKLYIIPIFPIIEYSWFTRWLAVLICSLLTIETIRRIIPNKYHKFIGIYD